MSLGGEHSRIAIHEAAHATIACVQGLGIKSAQLGDAPVVLLNHRLNRVTGQAVDERVRFLLAGFCADRRFAPRFADRRNSAADFEHALELVPTDERRWPSAAVRNGLACVTLSRVDTGGRLRVA